MSLMNLLEMRMRITEKELSIKKIIDIRRGWVTDRTVCESRHSDCFAFILSGESLYTFGDRTQTARGGDILYLAKGSRYTIDLKKKPYKNIFIDFEFENDENIIFENEVFSDETIKRFEDTFIKIHKLWSLGNFADKIFCKSVIYQIYAALVESRLFDYIPISRKSQIETAVDYISDNISNVELSITELSKMCDMSEVHLRRIFTQVYHMSPVKFIIMLRVNKAKELLGRDDVSIKEISERCGFRNQYYFSKTFKGVVGITPSEYRSDLKKYQ